MGVLLMAEEEGPRSTFVEVGNDGTDWNRPQGTMNMHPDMPRPNVPEEWSDLSKWSGLDRSDYASKRFTYGHISKERWEEIFGNA